MNQDLDDREASDRGSDHEEPNTADEMLINFTKDNQVELQQEYQQREWKEEIVSIVKDVRMNQLDPLDFEIKPAGGGDEKVDENVKASVLIATNIG